MREMLIQLDVDAGDRHWQERANCLGVDPDLFFPERGASTREAKEVCRGCVVREECLEYALANGEKFGRRHYHFVYRNVLFLILNTDDPTGGSGSGHISKEQIAWARETLKANKDVRWTIVAIGLVMTVATFRAAR